ncbi:MAG: hypothetical protein ACTHMW_15125 [Actinomycetes bacterium]
MSARDEHPLPDRPVAPVGDLVDAMETGSDAGTPGERPTAAPGEEPDAQEIEVAEAAADDRPLPSHDGGPQDDGMTPQFQEPSEPEH